MHPNRLIVLALLLWICVVVAHPSTKSVENVTATMAAATAAAVQSSTPAPRTDNQRLDDDYYRDDEPTDEYAEKMADVFELPSDVGHQRRRGQLKMCKNIICMPHYLCINDQIVTNGTELLEWRLSLRINGDQSNIVCGDMEMPCCADDAMAHLHQSQTQNNNKTNAASVQKENNDGNSASNGNSEHENVHLCGYRATTTNRILDADDALPNEFPWMVGLFLRLANDNLRYIGGGSLIHRSVIVTAAHLIRHIPIEQLIVRAGEHDILDPLNDGKRQERNISQKIMHDDLYVEALINDIALLVIDRPFRLTVAVNTVCIPPQSVHSDDRTQCASCGWGKNAADRNGKYQATLKKVILPIVSRAKCEHLLRRTRLGPFYNLNESLMCAGGGRRDTCKGDGGSPLFCEIPQDAGRFYQVGIVAGGIGCGTKVPGLYVNLAHFSNWIKHQLGDLNLNFDVENILSYELFE